MPGAVEWSFEARWPAESRHIRDARQFVCDQLRAAGLAHLVDCSALVVSELVTNAVVHARSPFRVRLSRVGDFVLVEVYDDSSDTADRRDHGPADLSGRGLDLVNALTSDWGVTPQPTGGKMVWARVPMTGSPINF